MNRIQHKCQFCGGPATCSHCRRTCAEVGGLTPEGLCAGCAVIHTGIARATRLKEQSQKETKP